MLCLVAKQVPVPLLLDGYCCLYRVQRLPTLHTVWGLLPAQFKVNPPLFVALIPCFLLVKPVFSFVHFNILLVEPMFSWSNLVIFLVCQIPALSVVLQCENVPAELRRLPESYDCIPSLAEP